MNAHCESCGSTDREDLETGDSGYSGCCNQIVCDGRRSDRYGTRTNYVTACCWAMATKEFKARGQEVPEGSSRNA